MKIKKGRSLIAKTPAHAILLLHCLFLRGSFLCVLLLTDALVQIRHTYLNLLLDAVDQLHLLIRKLKEVLIHRVGAASVNLSQLLRAEKLFLLNQPGADSKVLFGSIVVLHEVVPMTYACVPISPIPCDKVDSVFTLNSSQHSAIEIRQHLVAVLQTVGFQKGRRFLSPSGPTKRRPNLCEFFEKMLLPVGKTPLKKGAGRMHLSEGR